MATAITTHYIPTSNGNALVSMENVPAVRNLLRHGENEIESEAVAKSLEPFGKVLSMKVPISVMLGFYHIALKIVQNVIQHH